MAALASIIENTRELLVAVETVSLEQFKLDLASRDQLIDAFFATIDINNPPTEMAGDLIQLRSLNQLLLDRAETKKLELGLALTSLRNSDTANSTYKDISNN